MQIVVSPNIDSYIWDTIARTLQLLACGKQLQYFSVIFLQFSHHILQTHNSYTDPPHTRYRIHGYDLSYLQHSTSSAPSKQRYWEELARFAGLPSALHHFKIYFLVLLICNERLFQKNASLTQKFSYSSTHSSHTTSQLIHTGDISFGERAHDERDNLLAGGSWPTLNNSSRLNRHTWSASQPSAGTKGVW